MNKRLIEFIEKNGMKTEKNIHHGYINGFEVSVAFKGQFGFCFISGHVSPKRNEINNFISVNAKALKIYNYEILNDGIAINITAFGLKKLVDFLENVIYSVTNKLNEEEVLNMDYCPICGKEFNNNKVVIRNVNLIMTIDQDCSDEIKENLKQEDEDFKNVPNNYLKGTIGACLGALAGAILWVLVYMLGFVSAIVALLLALASSYGYDFFKGKPNKMKALIVGITSFVFVILAFLFIYYSISLVLIAEGDGTSFGDLLAKHDEFKRSFLADGALSILFGSLGIFYIVYNIFTKNKRTSEVTTFTDQK